MTVRDALDVSKRTVSQRDAEVLLGAALGKDRAWLHTHPEVSLTAKQHKQYEQYLTRREQNEPVAYIIGQKEFYGRPFKTDRRALIPRPETEAVVEQALQFLPAQFAAHLKATNKPCPLHILELGTGCGNIAITLALKLGKLPVVGTITATDISKEALELAQENWQRLGESNQNIRLEFINAPLFESEKIQGRAPFDLIVANLPYVSTTWKTNPAAEPEVIFHEPDVALFAGADGLDIYRQFFQHAPKYLAKDGQIIIEYGEDQTKAIRPLAAAAFPHHIITISKDYAGFDRVLTIAVADPGSL